METICDHITIFKIGKLSIDDTCEDTASILYGRDDIIHILVVALVVKMTNNDCHKSSPTM